MDAYMTPHQHTLTSKSYSHGMGLAVAGARDAIDNTLLELEPQPTAQLTLLSMNCRGLPVPLPGLRRRLIALGKALSAASVDVACLQEVGRWRYLPLLRHDETAWPHTVTMMHPYAPKGGLVTLSRLQVIETTYRAFQERGRAMTLHMAERYQRKGILHTTISVAGRSIVVLNTHLAANYSARWSYTNPYAKVERAQLREIAECVSAMPEEIMVVVAGDFNVPRGSWLYHELQAATGLTDPLEGSMEPTYRPMLGMPARAAQALDYILVRAPKQLSIAAQAELCFREPVWLAHGRPGYLSDHLGVRLTLSWSESPQATLDLG
jgi:endonuclease/exonuclease/phosphatase family metal-dependent hydrolase